MTKIPTDLQAALRKACEDAAKEMWATNSPSCLSESKIADIIERHLTPVFEALRDSVIEECAKRAMNVQVNHGDHYGAYFARSNDAPEIAKSIRALKGAPR